MTFYAYYMLITGKLHIVYEHFTYQTTALVSEMSIFVLELDVSCIGELWLQTDITVSFQ